MSFQRILDAARRLGTPVIVTDVAGREPMVLVPLDMFEALAGASSENGKAPAPAMQYDAVPERPVPPTPRPSESEPTPEELSALVGQEISLEDRFYLEPVDDSGDQK